MLKFNPTAQQIRLAECVFTAMAHESLIRPIVEKYSQEILEKHQFHIAKCWTEKGTEDRVILNRKDAFLMSDEDFAVYHAECSAARDAAGLKVENPEFCPLLVAEHLQIDAENALLSEMATTPGLESLGNTSMSLENRKKALDLSLRLLAPFCGKSDDILGRLLAA